MQNFCGLVTRDRLSAGAAAFTLMASAVACIPTTAQAQTQSASQGEQNVEEIVVTARKIEERLKDVPVPVTVLNADKLSDNGQLQLKDYYSSVPGLNINPNLYASDSIIIRGIATSSFQATVAVTIDGVPYGSATDTQVPDIDPGDLARVEVLRGPQGTLYGSDALGGVVNYVTKAPSTEAYSGRIEAGLSDVYNGTGVGYNLRAAINIPISQVFALRVSGFQRQDPGYIDNPILNVHGVNEAQTYGGRVAALWQPSDALSLKLSALYQDTHANGVSEVEAPTAGIPQTFGLGDLQQNYLPNVGAYDKPVQAYSATLEYDLDGVSLKSVTGFNIDRENSSLDQSYYYPGYTVPGHGLTGVYSHERHDYSTFTEELRASGSFLDSFDWSVGGYLSHERDPFFQDIYAEKPRSGQVVETLQFGKFGQNFDEYAGFANLTYHFTDTFDVQIGGRETHYRTTAYTTIQSGPLTGSSDPVITPGLNSNASAFTYLVTPRFMISPDIMLYARFASGYRPGGANAGYAIADGAPSQFSPDTTNNYEVGIKGDFLDHKISIDASLYYIDWSQIQISLATKAHAYGYVNNGGQAKSEGAEVSITARPWTGGTVTAWGAYDDAVLTNNFPANSTVYGVEGNRLPFSSTWSGNIDAQQDFRLWGEATGFVGGSISFIGDRESVFETTSARQNFPAYTKTDLRVGMNYDTWTVNGYVTNVGDVRGLVNGGDALFFPYIRVYIQPRTFGLNVSKVF